MEIIGNDGKLLDNPGYILGYDCINGTCLAMYSGLPQSSTAPFTSLQDCKSSGCEGYTIGVPNDIQLVWEHAKLKMGGPSPGPYCSNKLEGISGEDNVVNSTPDPSEPFCWGARYLTPGEYYSVNLWSPNGYIPYPNWQQGWEMWVKRPINEYGNWGNIGAFVEDLGLGPNNGFTHPCYPGTSSSPILFSDAHCIKLSPNTNYPFGDYMSINTYQGVPAYPIRADFRNYDEKVWDLMGDSTNSAKTTYTLNRILQDISSMANVHYEAFVAPPQAGGGIVYNYMPSLQNLWPRTWPVNDMYTSISTTDGATGAGTGAGLQIFNPPLKDQVLIDGGMYPGSKLSPGENCISYACHPDNVFVNGTDWDPINNYYSWVTMDHITVLDFDYDVWTPTPKWSFSNSTGWTGNIPTSLTSAKESAIGLMMYLGDQAWDPSTGPVNNADGSSTYGGPTGVCWLPANQYDPPGTGHWVLGGGSNGDCPPFFANPLTHPTLPGFYGDGNWYTNNATPSNIGHIDNTNWRNKPKTNAYYKGIRPSYTFLDVAQHLESMLEYMPLSYERDTYDWANRPCGHPTGSPPGCTPPNCYLNPAGPTSAGLTNCGGHVPNGLPRSVQNPSGAFYNNSSQGGGNCCSQAYMNSGGYQSRAFDEGLPGTDGTTDGIYNGFGCCDKRWATVAPTKPRLVNGLQCIGCTVGCCVDQYNEIDVCTSPLLNGLFRDLHDCEGAQQWEPQVLTSPIDVDTGHEKPRATDLGVDTFCKDEQPYNPGCLDPLAWNFCSTCNADCNGSSAYRQTTQSGSILNSTINYSCCVMEKPGWECNPNLPGCTQTCQCTVPNHLTECFETQAECEDETICAPGWSCENLARKSVTLG